MPNQYISTVDKIKTTELGADFIKSQAAFTSPFQSSSEFETGLPSSKTNTVELNLEDLRCFEVVERQFKDLGIIFRNAIAIQPSNPAFPPRSGTTLILAAPKNGFLEAIFPDPVRYFGAYVTSSQRTILSAYDRKDNLLARTEMPVPNLGGSKSPIPPNTQLSLSAPNIYRVTFYSFDGQLTVDDVSFAL